jgi:hypothetical protein
MQALSQLRDAGMEFDALELPVQVANAFRAILGHADLPGHVPARAAGKDHDALVFPVQEHALGRVEAAETAETLD